MLAFANNYIKGFEGRILTGRQNWQFNNGARKSFTVLCQPESTQLNVSHRDGAPLEKKKHFLIFENSRDLNDLGNNLSVEILTLRWFLWRAWQKFLFHSSKMKYWRTRIFLSFAVKKILFFDCISSPCLARFMLSTFINNELLNYPDYSPLVHKGGCNSPRLLTDEQLDSFWQCILVWTNQIVSG